MLQFLDESLVSLGLFRWGERVQGMVLGKREHVHARGAV